MERFIAENFLKLNSLKCEVVVFRQGHWQSTNSCVIGENVRHGIVIHNPQLSSGTALQCKVGGSALPVRDSGRCRVLVESKPHGLMFSGGKHQEGL